MPLTYTENQSSPRNSHVWTFDADGNGTPARLHRAGMEFTFGVKLISSDYGGGTLKWQWLPIGLETESSAASAHSSWSDVGAASTTAAADGTKTASLSPGWVRPVLSGSTSPVIECYCV